MKRWIVVDLGFGDAGKGTITDALVRREGASLVVRFNGGAQAGHNVVTDDGRHHTFSQLCSGLLAGADGLLGPDFLLHPLAMEIEAEHITALGVADPFASTFIDARARVITPYQQASCRLREASRGEGAHGTTGVGVGECASDTMSHPSDAITAAELRSPDTLLRKLSSQRERKRAEMASLGAHDLSLFDDEGLVSRVIDRWTSLSGRLRLLDPDQTEQLIDRHERVVFEGAQGVLLDETWGLHPHTTWSDCTPAGAKYLCRGAEAQTIGVTRAYMVRHGRGPMPTERTPTVPEPHNREDGWQGRFRTGPLDCVLLRYALEVCGGVDTLAVTCLDRVDPMLLCTAYLEDAPPALASSQEGRVRRLHPGAPEDLSHRERLGAWLQGVRCEIVAGDLARLEMELSRPVTIESWGPSARDKRWR